VTRNGKKQGKRHKNERIEAKRAKEWRKESRANRGTQELDFTVRENAPPGNGIKEKCLAEKKCALTISRVSGE
jgi:hypothetical protein